MVFGKGINDMTSKIPSYSTWHSMIRRCYSEVYHKNKPTYVGTTVEEKWLRLSVFNSWFENNYIEGWQLDKDLLSNFGKLYSESTCCFLPNDVNCALKFDIKDSGLPAGVSFKTENSKYVAQYSRLDENGKRKGIHILYSNDPNECFLAYKKAKESYIRELAEKYKSKIPNKVYMALCEIDIK